MRLDRKGSTALAFAAGASALFGLAALGTEAGSWFLTRRAAQSAADAAALAGAVVLAGGGTAQAAQAAATDLAGRNGFSAGGRTTLAVHAPPASGPSAGRNDAVEVVLHRQERLALASLFLAEAPTVAARAVAVAQPLSDSCVLSLNGPLTLSGHSSTGGSGCVLASNNRGAGSITMQGAASVQVYSMVMGGGCNGCAGNTRLQLERPYAEYQPALPDPYAALDNKTLPSFGGGSCLNPGSKPSALLPYESTGKAYCADVKVTGNTTLTLTPGTYYFWNASLSAQNAAITCNGCTGGQGVTLVFTGNPATVGSVQINGNVQVTLAAPRSAADPDWNGVLMFRDPRAVAGGSATLNGTESSTISGAMYLPNTDVTFLGNGALTDDSCIALVAGTISFTGNASVAGCARAGTAVPQVQAVRLTE